MVEVFLLGVFVAFTRLERPGNRADRRSRCMRLAALMITHGGDRLPPRRRTGVWEVMEARGAGPGEPARKRRGKPGRVP